MTITLPQLTEIHSSDLTAKCLRERYHVHRGEVDAEATTALYRGLVAGEALRKWREDMSVPRTTEIALMLASGGADSVDETLVAENRPLSKSVVENRTRVIGEVARNVLHYMRRMPQNIIDKSIGCELPIRCTFIVDDEPIEFASHLDYLWRNTSGTLVVDDDKWREDNPTFEYLRRNEQFACYAYAARFGEIMVDGHWLSFGEWPLVRWIDLARFTPYSRKVVDNDGVEYAKGDDRPMEKLVRHVQYGDDSAARIESMVTERVRMIRAGLWPTNSDPIGCQICQSKRWCTTFDTTSY